MRAKYQNGLCAILALVAAIVLASGPLHSRSLLDVWRSAFAPRMSPSLQQPVEFEFQKQLGGKLFRDPRLSGDVTRACVSCHKPELGFTDGLARAMAVPGSNVELRNTPTLYGLGSAHVFNWDGSATGLAQQALGPIQNAGELAATFADIVARLTQDEGLVQAFEKAFPTAPDITQDTITKALARYVGSLRAPKTSFDTWIAGDDGALKGEQRFGFDVFVGKGGCVACHVGPRLTDEAFHDIGLPDDQRVAGQDVAGKRGMRAFKTPTLRAISKTAPYMHNGTLETLRDVVDHYAGGMIRRRGVSSVLPPKLELTAKEKDALVAFLKTL